MNSTPTDTLNRWAAVVTVLVEAGCEGPRGTLLEHGALVMPDQAVPIRSTQAVIAANEQWFSQTVVPWAMLDKGISIIAPRHTRHRIKGEDTVSYRWRAGYIQRLNPSPTEAYLQCAEALAKVIGDKQ